LEDPARCIPAVTWRMHHILQGHVRKGAAVGKAVSEGEREFTAIAVIGDSEGRALLVAFADRCFQSLTLPSKSS